MNFNLKKVHLNEYLFQLTNLIIRLYKKYFYNFDKNMIEYKFVYGTGLALREIETMRSIEY